MQEVFLGLKEANPDRLTGFEKTNHLPYPNWVRRFAERHSIVLRCSVEISKGRQILTARDLELWQQDTEAYLLSNPVFAECFKDPSRLFNQDESSIELGSGSRRVLAKRGTKVIYHVSSGSRDHITTSFACNAAGGMVPPRVIHKGVRNMAAAHLQNLPEDGLSGKWNFSVSPKGYITRPLFLEVLKDINSFVEQNTIQKPVIVILDGASPHLSIEAAAYCKANQIQPWLLRPNMTHLTQPLDLVFFADLKKTLKNMAWAWQTDPKNTGQFLNKYSVVVLLKEATEVCLTKPGLVENGFKRAGLFPWDKSAPDVSKLLPGTVFNSTQTKSTINSTPTNSNPINLIPIMPTLTNCTPTNSTPISYTPTNSFPTNSTPSISTQPTSVSNDTSPSDFDTSLDLDFIHSSSQDNANQICSTPNKTLHDSIIANNIHTSDNELVQEIPTNQISDIEDTPNDSTFPEVTPSIINAGFPLPKTFKCGACNRIILERFRCIHLSSCLAVNDLSQIAPDPVIEFSPGPSSESEKENSPALTLSKLSTVPVYSHEERVTMLNKFEVLLLTHQQVAEFKSKYSTRSLVHEEPLFSAWLTLKLATIPTEKEALDKVLRSHEATNVTKKQTNRKRNVPSGPTRFDPISQDWVNILEETSKSAEAKKKKSDQKDAVKKAQKEKRCKKAPEPKSKKKTIRN